jgi:CDP-diacylglycerol--glycerol-3-phosphate 3-phosphatidyltransferase
VSDRGRVVLGAVTWLRALLVPVIIVLVLASPGSTTARVVGTVIFTAAGFTDLLDGYLARRWRFQSALGGFLDTTADKLLVSGTLLALVEIGRVSTWIAFLIIGRELVLLALKGVVAAGGASVDPSSWGKWKATVQFIAIGMAIAHLGPRIGPLHLDGYAMLVATALTVISAIDYLGRYRGAFSTEA